MPPAGCPVWRMQATLQSTGLGGEDPGGGFPVGLETFSLSEQQRE